MQPSSKELKSSIAAARLGFALIQVQEMLARAEGHTEEERIMSWFNSFKTAGKDTNAPADLPIFMLSWMIANWPVAKTPSKATNETTVAK